MNANIGRVATALTARTVASTVRKPRACFLAKWLQIRGLTTSSPQPPVAVPLRKHLKAEAKSKKAEARSSGSSPRTSSDISSALLSKWELTVGIEIHAELNTAHKLFSRAPAVSAESNGMPNAHVALFDAAMPGSQPQFQQATLLPALRAAIALGCEVQRKSGWDRKHYFHWDQPNGYQITQYYQPFAVNGQLKLEPEDGVPAADLNGAEAITIGIKQIQMEQDTAKTTHHPPSTYHVDLNRAGHPLIEIITLPQIHSPQTAAALVRKIQGTLKSVDACVTGMELGGLRADVNVSVRQRGTEGTSEYSGVKGLGQRTEIKNLSSFAMIEAAIIAERDRQIGVLESGGVIEGETRGWSLGATETTRLRGKEGEVDYRYLPDADLPPLFIGRDLVKTLKSTLPELPNETIGRIQAMYGLSPKDAKTIYGLDDGERLEYMEEVVELIMTDYHTDHKKRDPLKFGKMASNWILHELGGLLTTKNTEWSQMNIPAQDFAHLLSNLDYKQITARSAKQLLARLHERPLDHSRQPVGDLIDEMNLRLRPLSNEAYEALAKEVMDENPDMVAAVREKRQKGKMMWIVGQMVRRGEEGTVEPERAKKVVEHLLKL